MVGVVVPVPMVNAEGVEFDLGRAPLCVKVDGAVKPTFGGFVWLVIGLEAP